MTVKNLKRTKKVETKRLIGLDGLPIGGGEDQGPVYFIRTVDTITAVVGDSFENHNFFRSESQISLSKV